MKKVLSFFTSLLVLLTHSISGADDFCSKRTPINVCLFASASDVNPNHCGLVLDRFPVKTIDDINRVFEFLYVSCKSVKNLLLLGHASEFTFNDIKLFEWDRVNAKNPILPNALVLPLGCNMGVGCSGAVQMSMIGKNLLKQGGKLQAATSLSFSRSNSIPSALGKRIVEVKPTNNGVDMIWSLTGLQLDSREPDPVKVCAQEAAKLVQEIKTSALLPTECRQRLLSHVERYVEFFDKSDWSQILAVLGDSGNSYNIETFLSLSFFKERYKILCGLK